MNLLPLDQWFPASKGWRREEESIGESEARVWRLFHEAGKRLVIKRQDASRSLQHDFLAHQWFYNRNLSPNSIWHQESDGGSWLLMEMAEGVPAYQLKKGLGTMLGTFLANLHHLPLNEWTLLHSHSEEKYQQLASLATLYPLDPVISHGDCCLPNLIIDRNEHVRMIDLGMSGICDRYRDLERILWSLEFNKFADQIPAFLSAYGLKDLNAEKLESFRTLSW